jgi:hypothetical protein
MAARPFDHAPRVYTLFLEAVQNRLPKGIVTHHAVEKAWFSPTTEGCHSRCHGTAADDMQVRKFAFGIRGWVCGNRPDVVQGTLAKAEYG